MNQLSRVCLLFSILFYTVSSQDYRGSEEPMLNYGRVVESVIKALTNETLAIVDELKPEYVSMASNWILNLHSSGMLPQGPSLDDQSMMMGQPRPYESDHQRPQQYRPQQQQDRMRPNRYQEVPDQFNQMGQSSYGQSQYGQSQQGAQQSQYGQPQQRPQQSQYMQSQQGPQQSHYGQPQQGPQQSQYGQSQQGSQQIQFQQVNPGLKRQPFQRRPRSIRKSLRSSDFNEDDYIEGWTH